MFINRNRQVKDQALKNKVNKDGIEIHPASDFEGMRRAGRLAAEVLDMITDHVRVGVTTEELNTLCHDYIVGHNAIPAPLNYKGFPKSICTSINEVVCHGIPSSDRYLKNGDIINIDVTVILDGWYGDTSRMYIAGDAKIKPKRLIDVTYNAMMAGISAVKPGATLGDISKAIQKEAHAAGYKVVKDFCGHGLGTVFHTEPQILHYFDAKSALIKGNPWSLVLEPGMFFTIEPMINTEEWETKVLKDGWTAITKGLSAQFEHSLAVTEAGVEIFTLSPKGYTKPPY
jgi:methionyl aminopeptidase